MKWNGLGKSATGELQTFLEIPRAPRNNYKLLSLVVFHNWEATMASLGVGRASGQGEGLGAPSFEYRTKLFLTGKNLGWRGDGRKLTWAHLPSENDEGCLSPHRMSAFTCYWITKMVVLRVWCGGRIAGFSITLMLCFPCCIFKN